MLSDSPKIQNFLGEHALANARYVLIMQVPRPHQSLISTRPLEINFGGYGPAESTESAMQAQIIRFDLAIYVQDINIILILSD